MSDTITIDKEDLRLLLLSSFRYALKRSSYLPGSIRHLITQHRDALFIGDGNILAGELAEAKLTARKDDLEFTITTLTKALVSVWEYFGIKRPDGREDFLCWIGKVGGTHISSCSPILWRVDFKEDVDVGEVVAILPYNGMRVWRAE